MMLYLIMPVSSYGKRARYETDNEPENNGDEK
jgi:hypothetical protein